MAPTMMPSRLGILNVRVPSYFIPATYYLAPLLVMSYSSMSYYNDMLSTRLRPNSTDPNYIESFDFIIVGGGSAGAVLSNRLSRHSQVVLIEAGGNPHPLASIPIANAILLGQGSIAWKHRTVPQFNSSLGLIDQVARWPRGKSLGGSSVLNSMIYMRGHPKDYDENFAKITGDDEWRYENLLPFFKKLEDYHGHFPKESVHGTGGPIHVEKLRADPASKYWLAAGKEFGYNTQDLNENQLYGFAPMDVTMKKGTRFDTYRAYLRPLNGKRDNLTIYRYAQVIKIHLDKEKRAYGVTYIRHGIQKFVRARKEVIISAGSLNTPQLLMLSGIGPKQHLNSKGIKCRVHLPNVGQNLQDHIFTNVGPIILNKPVSLIADRDTTLNSLGEFVFNGSGPLVSITGISGAGAFTTSLAGDPEWPDIIYHFIGAGIHRSFGHDQERSFGFRRGFLQNFYKPHIGKDANFVLVVLGRPKSSGSVRLRSKDPFDKLVLDAGYLTDRNETDLKAFVEGIRFVLDLFHNTKTYQKLGAKLSQTPLEECSHHEFNSDDYWKCFVRHYSITIHHQCCTCAMGRGRSDPFAVVDPRLRVIKTKNLRVIDMSIFPEIINANPNVPVIMLGEKGSYFIREHWANQYLICDYQEYFLYNDAFKCYYSQWT